MDSYDWGVAILQCLVSIGTILIAYTELKKEYRKRQKIAHKEANSTWWLLLLSTLITVALILVQNHNSLQDKDQLNSILVKIQLKNDNLEKQIITDNHILKQRIDKTKDTLANIAADKALRAGIQVEKKAKELENMLFGDGELLWFGGAQGDKYNEVQARVVNDSEYPKYDVNVKVYDYRKQQLCRTMIVNGVRYIDSECLYKAERSFVPFNIARKSITSLPLLFEFKNGEAKYLIFFKTRSMNFCEEYMMINGKEIFRLFTVNKNGTRKITKIYNPNNIHLNWSEEFNLPPVMQMIPFPPSN